MRLQYCGHLVEMLTNIFVLDRLSKWETKLRDDFKIRKKIKAGDWPLVYRHLAPRLNRPGKKGLSQPTTIRLYGKEIPFDDAWKEIRRSRAHKLSPRLRKLIVEDEVAIVYGFGES